MSHTRPLLLALLASFASFVCYLENAYAIPPPPHKKDWWKSKRAQLHVCMSGRSKAHTRPLLAAVARIFINGIQMRGAKLRCQQ